MSLTELFERFLAMEKREALFSRQIGGVPYWHLVRFYVFKNILNRTFSLKSAHPDLTASGPPVSRMCRIIKRIRYAWWRILDVTVRNPALVLRRCPVLFSMTPRQAILSDGRQVSLLLDFLAPRLRSRHVLLEHVLVEPTRQPFWRRVLHLPSMDNRFSECRQNGRFADTEDERREAAEAVAKLLSAEFGMTLDASFVKDQIDGALLYREVYLPVLVKMLRRMRVRIVVTAVHYNLLHFTLAEAAHELGIPVAELQHGTIYSSHPAYNLPDADSRYSPDYFLSWGDFWNRQMRNYPRRECMSVGYPYLEHERMSYECRENGGVPTVLFVSQANVADELIVAALELRKLLPQHGFNIAYKLHPNESRDWRSLYPRLVNSGVEVVSNRDRNIYACFDRATFVVGDCSTALIEALAWGLRVLIFRSMPGSDVMDDFVRLGVMEYVDSAEELAQRMNSLKSCRGAGTLDTSTLFKMPDSAKNAAFAIDALAHCAMASDAEI